MHESAGTLCGSDRPRLLSHDQLPLSRRLTNRENRHEAVHEVELQEVQLRWEMHRDDMSHDGH